MITKLLAGIFALSLNASPPRHRASLHSSLAAFDDRGIFLLSVAGREIGREKFTIRSSGHKIEAQAEIELHVEQNGKMLLFKTFPYLLLNSELRPLSYRWQQKGPQSSFLEVDFQSSPAKTTYRTIAGDQDKRDFVLPKDVLVLDDNVIHQYELIADRFKLSARGKQTFHAFIPQEALPGDLTVEESGTEPVRIGGRSEVLHHLVITTELTRVDLWLDDRQRLRLVTIPAAHLEAVRKE